VIDLATNRVISYHGDHLFAQASSIKVSILIEMFKAARAGKLKLDDKITLQPGDKVGGSGHLQILLRNGPISLTIRELVTAMIETSDNTATNKCIALVGMDRVNATLTELGLKNTRLQRRMLDSDAAARDAENISTPLDMVRLVELIYKGKAVDPEASREMISILKLVDGDIRKTIPAQYEVAAKPGQVPGVRCETGIVFLKNRPFAISVMSAFLDPGANPVPDATRIIYECFQKLDDSNLYGNKIR
jgi:beta-lactamase class A